MKCDGVIEKRTDYIEMFTLTTGEVYNSYTRTEVVGRRHIDCPMRACVICLEPGCNGFCDGSM